LHKPKIKTSALLLIAAAFWLDGAIRINDMDHFTRAVFGLFV